MIGRVVQMSKLAIASIILLLAGIGLALGAAGSCICPNSSSCAQTGCMEKCAGPCASGAKDPSACICPNNTSCAQTGCMEKCAGPCASGAKDPSACICPNNASCEKTGCLEKCAGPCSRGGNPSPSGAASCPRGGQFPGPDKASCAMNSNLAPSCTC